MTSFGVSCSSITPKIDHHSHSSLSSFSSTTLKPLSKEVQQQSNPISRHVAKTVKQASVRLLNAFVDSSFQFLDQPLLPSQRNFAPVEEIGEAVDVTETINGRIPDDFPAGVYIRNGPTQICIGYYKSTKDVVLTFSACLRQHDADAFVLGPNPLFGGLKSTNSVFGKSSHSWIEGEGMLHALYFSKNGDGRSNVTYRNRFVETDTFKLEKAKKKPTFLPAIEGDSLAVLSAYLLNYLRFGFVNKYLSNTSVFEHSGKLYSSAENHIPQEIDLFTLETRRNWDVNGSWNRPFTSHPKKDQETGELVIMGIHPEKPYFELGVISADGNKLLHRVDLKLDRCCLCHEIGITTRYNVIMDFPLTLDINRLIRGGPLIKYNEEGYARIGIMPRYGEADSLKWFDVEPGCTFHIINCHEQDDEVVVLACRSRVSIIPGPDFGLNKHQWFSKGFNQMDKDEEREDSPFLSRVYEWRLNLRTNDVVERNLTTNDYSMEFPIINDKYIGKTCKYGYTQVVDPKASATSGMAKYGGLSKLHLQERKIKISANGRQHDEIIKVEHHRFPHNTFCSGAAFVAKRGGVDEDDGWIVTYVHNEDRNTSQMHIVDAKNFSKEPVAIIELPSRVPYGFHGAFMPF